MKFFTQIPTNDIILIAQEEDPYMTAVESDDVEEAQRIGDKKAKEDGYTIGPAYHGSKSRFDIFDMSKAGTSDPGLAGPGLYFTMNPDDARSISENETFGKGADPNVQTVYVALHNPFIISMGRLPDGRTVRDVHGGTVITRKGGDEIRKLAEEGGHDGVAFTDKDGAFRHVVVWSPSQVKSVSQVSK
jgi:hypothetical protein